MNAIDMDGKRFGMLTVMYYVATSRRKRRYMCRCDCGNITVAAGADIRYGRHVSCGCYRRTKLQETMKAHHAARREALQ